MRAGLLLIALVLLGRPALADQNSFPMDYPTCRDAIHAVAEKLNLPLRFTVNTPKRITFPIATSGGVVTMQCDRDAGTLTIFTPAGVSALPFITGG